MNQVAEMKLVPGMELELIHTYTYRERLEEHEYTEDLPVGRKAVYMGKLNQRVINVYKEIRPKYIDSHLMHFDEVVQSGGHRVAIADSKGWNCYLTFPTDDDLFKHLKIKE